MPDTWDDQAHYAVVSADMHAGADLGTYRDYLDPTWHEEFDRWVQEQKQPAAPPDSEQNRKAFLSSACIACHTVQGTTARGKSGPDLTHMMSRQTLASGAIPNTPESLRAWIQDPQKFKPGNLMPAVKLKDGQLDEMVAYLLTLR